MIEGPALQNLTAAIAEACGSGLPPDALRAVVLPKLRRAVPIDALWWATADPMTLLFTQAHRDGLPEEIGPYFVQNEFLQDDANKWTHLARSRDGVRTLLAATAGELDTQRPLPRHLQAARAVRRLRCLCAPATRAGATCACTARVPGCFSPAEAQFVGRVAPYLAEGIRLGLLVRDAGAERADAPGLLLLADDWLADRVERGGRQLGGRAARPPAPTGCCRSRCMPLPPESLRAAMASRAAPPPRLRVWTRAGRWVVIHASWRGLEDRATAAVIIEPAPAVEIAPLLMAAYGLTPRERTVTGLVCSGFSTREISARLEVAEHTVQDHLKSVFARTGVRSRRRARGHDPPPGVPATSPGRPTGRRLRVLRQSGVTDERCSSHSARAGGPATPLS